METISRILVPTDLSEHSLAGVTYARDLARLCGARITLLYVVDVMPAVYPMPVDVDTAKLYRDTTDMAAMDLRLFVAEKLGGDESLAREVALGNPFEEIVRRAEDDAFDLIVIATHGRTGLRHMLMGSVAEKVVRFSAVPVVSVKPVAMLLPRVPREEAQAAQ